MQVFFVDKILAVPLLIRVFLETCPHVLNRGMLVRLTYNSKEIVRYSSPVTNTYNVYQIHHSYMEFLDCFDKTYSQFPEDINDNLGEKISIYFTVAKEEQ